MTGFFVVFPLGRAFLAHEALRKRVELLGRLRARLEQFGEVATHAAGVHLAQVEMRLLVAKRAELVVGLARTAGLTHDCRGKNPVITLNSNVRPVHVAP